MLNFIAIDLRLYEVFYACLISWDTLLGLPTGSG